MSNYKDKPPFGNPPHSDCPMEDGMNRDLDWLKEMNDRIPKPPKASELYGGLEDIEDEETGG
jgi:hypothetical protein